MNDWIFLLPSIIFTKVKNSFSKKIKEQYGMEDKNFSTVDEQTTDPVFPFVSIRLLPTYEKGRDLEGIEINSALFAFQITVLDNKSQARTRNVMSEIFRIMKKLGFEVSSMPEFFKTDVHECVARFQRNITKNDVL